MSGPPLTPQQAVSVWRHRYPDALVCTTCGRLLATERWRYAQLTADHVRAYVCAECRLAAAEAARIAASKVEQGRRLAEWRSGRNSVTQFEETSDPVLSPMRSESAPAGANDLAYLPSELCDTEREPLFQSTRRRRGRRPAANPTRLRQARYRQHHPGRVVADLVRVRQAVPQSARP
jgi:hypothetical protein